MPNAPTNPPHGLIAKEVRRGRVVPFLGAGVNFGARPPGEAWKLNAKFLPSGKELSNYLATLTNLVADDPRDIEDLAKVASYHVDSAGERSPLRADLREIFINEYSPCNIHTYLAEEALHYVDGEPAYQDESSLTTETTPAPRQARGTPLLIVTTNYDDLTEKAFQALNRPYDLVIYPTDSDILANAVLWWKDRGHKGEHSELVDIAPNSLHIDLWRTNVIYKMHGSIDRVMPERDSFVITEEDYVDFLSRLTRQGAIPMQFMSYFNGRRFLFLGYGLNDWNLRVVLRNLGNALPTVGQDSAQLKGQAEVTGNVHVQQSFGEKAAGNSSASPKSWAIRYEPSALEVSLWRARKVDIFDQDVNIFAERLRAFARSLPVGEASILP